MKTRTLWLNVILLVTLLVPGAIPAISQANAQAPASIIEPPFSHEYAIAPDRIIVKFHDSIAEVRHSRSGLSTGIGTLDTLLTAQHVRAARQLFAGQPLGAPDADLARIYRLDLLPGSVVEDTVAAFAAHPAIEWAEPDYLAYPASNIPDDPLFSQQWGLTKIQAPEAWDIVTGTQTIVIAMVDSGIDISHQDLVNRLWVNPGEIPGNGLDDDNNGFVDDVRGWNFVHGTADINDGNGHGTQVAGVAAAATDDGVGIAGVCWNCRIMPVRVMADSGVSNYSDIALGVRYAADKGAAVINLSLGGYAYSNALRDAINYAVNVKNAVVVGGAGNDNVATAFYPAAYETVLAVAATTNADSKAAFSDYGTWVDLSAPGETITTTFLGGDWGAANGTSLAAPFVSGVAALVRSQHPDWSAALVRNQLLQTADALDVLNPVYAGKLGTGRVNAMRATQDPHPIITLVGTSVNDDPLGRPIPGETATLAVTLRNDWWDAMGITGELATVDPLVTVEQATAGYGDLISSASGVSNPVYTFTVTAGAGYSHAIPFTLSISANDGAYTATIPLTITTRSGDEHFCGTVAEDMVWTNDKTYILDCNVGIAPGYTLTIQAGTEVHFNGNYNLNVGGALVADGTAPQPIRFMSHTGGSWGRIFFDDPSADAQSTSDGVYQSGNLLRHVHIEGAAQGIGCTNATPFLEYVTLDGGGLGCIAGDTALWVRDSDLGGDVHISQGSGVDSVIGGWVTRASMPTARGSLAVTVASNGRLYAIGGVNAGALTTVEEYDPARDTWTVRTPMSTVHYGFGLAPAPNGKLYAIGGHPELSTAIVEEYDLTLDAWTTRTPMPTARGFLAAVAAPNNRIYAIGGLHTDYLTTVEEYDPATDTWTTYTPMQTARSGLAAAIASNGKLYAVGGVNFETLATIEEYDWATDAWITRTPMPTARNIPATVGASNGKLYVIGGLSYGETVATVEEYDPLEDTWRVRASLPTARHGLAAAVAPNGKVYAIGGANDTGYLATVEEFTPPTEEYGYHVYSSILRGGLTLPETSQVLTSTINGNIVVGNDSIVRYVAAGGGIFIDGSGTVADSIANGEVSLSNGFVENTTVRNGGVNVGSGSALNNTISGGSINVSSGGVARDNSIENTPGWGIQVSGDATVEYNRIVGCGNGIQTDNGIVKGNLIANITGTGLEIGSATVVSNTFTGIGGNAVRITSGAPVKIAGNNFEFNTGTYDVENLILATALPTIDARNNWWGTTEGNVIQTRIFDYGDDYTLGTVLHAPVLAAPATDAPAYVRSVTLAPESPVGIQTVTFDVEFSREMDTMVAPSLAFANEEGWVSQNPMPTARRQFEAVTTPDGRIYTVGGYGGSFLATMEEYDPVSNTWRARQSMPTARVDPAVAVTPNGRILVIGGNLDGVRLNTIEEYDPATDTWRTLSPMPTARQDAGAVTAPNGLIYVIGGTTGDWNHLSNVEVYDPIMDTWQTRSPMPTARGSLGVVLGHNGRIYAIGGNNGVDNEGSMGTVEEYDPATDTWRTRATMPTSRRCLATVTSSNGRIYAVGGLSAQVELLDTLEEYDPVANSWQQLEPLSFPRMAFTAAPAVGSTSFYVIGGYVITDNLAAVEKYTPPISDPELYNASWPQPDHYRSSSDITALIPRGVYHLTVSDAVGTDGIEIAPNSITAFTVDYAGAINDTTPPPMPSIIGCAGTTPDALSAEWSVNDPESAITLYQYAIGTTLDGAEVVNWTNTAATEMSRSGLALSNGQRVYISVRARNEGGLWSQAGSIGVLAGSGECDQNRNNYPIYLPLVLRTQP